MDMYNAVKGRRSIRKYEDKTVPNKILKKCVNAGRLSPSAANKQPLKFITITKRLKEIFSCTNWAGYLEWEPEESEMPRAYIAIIKKKDHGWDIDAGIAAQSICLTAYSEGLGSCILGSIDREKLSKILPVPEEHEIKYLVGLGYPSEKAEVVECKRDVEYYHEDGVLKVPKRPIEDIWIKW
ncbi:MAG: nitroreductase family protein [Candidatus Saliniplasma sp.]